VYGHLRRGETFLLDRLSACTTGTCTLANGSLDSRIVIQGNQTLQVKFVAGNPGQTYCARGLGARGASGRTTTTRRSTSPPASPGNTGYYLHNPNASAITITWESASGSGSLTSPRGAPFLPHRE
jgi:hypothetical protein